MKKKLHKIYMEHHNDLNSFCQVLETNTSVINARDCDGQCLLSYAINDGNLSAVELLLSFNAYPLIYDLNGNCPLSLACSFSNDNLLDLLVVNALPSLMDDDISLLYSSAACAGKTENLSILLKHGLNINLKYRNWPILFWAIQSGDIRSVQFVINNMSKVKKNINYKDNDGFSPVYIAASHGHSDIVEYLHKNYANIDSPTKDGTTPLMIASSYGHSQSVAYLLENGSHVNLSDKDGTTALMMAVKYGHLEIIENLLFHNADMSLVDYKNKTVLDYLRKVKNKEKREKIESLLITSTR